jgi:hypothetical protein
MGTSWEVVSPDLTRNIDEKQGNGGGPYTNEAVGAENYGTLAYIKESPHEAGLIWTGSDDGFVYLTKDGGANWENVTPKGLEECLINAIEVSPHDPATAYIATTRYKFDDKTPGIYKTTNYGKTWTNISSNIPYGAFTRVVREDTKVKDLLYAGTETGMYLSRDGGRNWENFQLNLPITPITDLIQAHGDLIVATAGRSFWILDDLNLVREAQQKVDKPLVYSPDEVILGNWYSRMNGNIDNFDGTDAFSGVNPASGMVIYYHLPENATDSTELILTIHNSKGELVRTFSSKKDENFKSYAGGPSAEPVLSSKKGINRFVWNLSYPTMPGVDGAYIEAGYGGHTAIPGEYRISIQSDLGSSESMGVITKNPLYEITEAQYQEYHEFMFGMEKELTKMHRMVNTEMEYQEQLSTFLDKIKENEMYSSLHSEGEKLLKALKAWDESMIQRKSKAYDDVENFPNKFTANYMYVINQSDSSIPKINKGSKERRAELEEEWEVLENEGNRLLTIEIPAYNKLVQEAGIGVLFVK